MRSRHLLAATLLLHGFVLGTPTKGTLTKREATSTKPPSTQETAGKRIISNRCSTSQKLLEAVAFAESKFLSEEMSPWYGYLTTDPDGFARGAPFQNAVAMYLGDTSASYNTYDNELIAQPRNYLSRAFGANYDIHHDQASHVWTYVYCDEQDIPQDIVNNKCDQKTKKCCQPDTVAVHWSEPGTFWSKHGIVFCPRWFQKPTLSELTRSLKSGYGKPNDIEKLYGALSRTYYHEVMHFDKDVADPPILDYTADPVGCYDTARKYDVFRAGQAADCYALAALAIYQMNAFDLTSPPTPGGVNIPTVTDAEANTTHSDTTILELGNITATWMGPQDPNDANSFPDMTNWTVPTEVTLDPKDYQSYTIPNSLPTPSCVPIATGFGPTTDTEYARNLSKTKYCQYMATSTAGGVVIDSSAPYGPVGYAAAANQPQTLDESLWFSISLMQVDECKTGFEVTETSCENMFDSLLNGCNTNGATQGGSVVYGCGIYEIRTTVGSGDTPPKGISAETSGWTGY